MNTTSTSSGLHRVLLLAGFALALSGFVRAQPTCLNTLLAGGTSGRPGGSVLFDLNVQQGVSIERFDCHFAAPAGTPVQLTVHVTPGSYIGNEITPTAWTQVAADDGTATSSGPGALTSVVLQAPFVLPPGDYGLALVAGASTGHAYTTGNGTNEVHGDATLTLTAGAAQNAPFTAGAFTPRVFNGGLCYTLATGAFAEFSATPREGASPLQVDFADHSFSAAPGGITAWEWDIDGDGLLDYLLQNPRHVYTQSGTYDVTLTIRDAQGAHTLTKPAFIVVDRIQADFDAQAQSLRTVQFTDTSSGSPLAWEWDFDGDGTIDDTTQNPAWTYTECGAYDVSLTATNTQGADTKTVTLEVGRMALPGFQNTYSSTIGRGFVFRAPVDFSIVGLQVPDEAFDGRQNVAVYNFGPTPPSAYPVASPATPLLYVENAPSDRVIETQLSFHANDHIVVVGACGDANTLHTSYGAGEFATDVLGHPVTLTRVLEQENFVAQQGQVSLSTDFGGSIGRVHLCLSSATSFAYGPGTPSGAGPAAPVLETRAGARIGKDFRLTVTQGDPAALGTMLLGFGRANLPLSFGTILVGGLPLNFPFPGPLAVGANDFVLPIPHDPALIGGGPINWQNVNIAPGSPNLLSLSNGVEVFLGE